MNERKRVKEKFRQLLNGKKMLFRSIDEIDLSTRHGVYIILRNRTVLHVGRTIKGRNGLRQRIRNHIHGASSFAKGYFKGAGSILKAREYSFKLLEIGNERTRALVEAYAIGHLCPRHMGTGIKKRKSDMKNSRNKSRN